MPHYQLWQPKSVSLGEECLEQLAKSPRVEVPVRAPHAGLQESRAQGGAFQKKEKKVCFFGIASLSA
jgi:hypothetical protein